MAKIGHRVHTELGNTCRRTRQTLPIGKGAHAYAAGYSSRAFQLALPFSTPKSCPARHDLSYTKQIEFSGNNILD
jgi:hypothetical protein